MDVSFPSSTEIDLVDELWEIDKWIVVALHPEYLSVAMEFPAVHIVGLGLINERG